MNAKPILLVLACLCLAEFPVEAQRPRVRVVFKMRASRWEPRFDFNNPPSPDSGKWPLLPFEDEAARGIEEALADAIDLFSFGVTQPDFDLNVVLVCRGEGLLADSVFKIQPGGYPSSRVPTTVKWVFRDSLRMGELIGSEEDFRKEIKKAWVALLEEKSDELVESALSCLPVSKRVHVMNEGGLAFWAIPLDPVELRLAESSVLEIPKQASSPGSTRHTAQTVYEGDPARFQLAPDFKLFAREDEGVPLSSGPQTVEGIFVLRYRRTPLSILEEMERNGP